MKKTGFELTDKEKTKELLEEIEKKVFFIHDMIVKKIN